MKTFKKIRRIIFIIGIISSIFAFIMEILFTLDKLDIVDAFGGSSMGGISLGITDPEIDDLLKMSDKQVWEGLTGGLLSDIPSEEMPANASAITSAVESRLETITVPTWAWENEGDTSNLKRVTKNRTLQVNKFLSKLWITFFTELYNTDKNFVIAEGFLGGYRVDGIDPGIGYRSAHTYGAAVDINWYEAGNPDGYKSSGTKAYTKEEWQKLPENHEKYQIIYIDSPIVQIAHKYTLLWGGGDWTGDYIDIMHFSFVCDGKTREQRVQMFRN